MAVATMTGPNERALRGEAEWLPTNLEEIVAIRRVLLESGCTRAVADGIVGWLVTKAAGEEDSTHSTTRASYRKILASLESPLPASVSGVIPR